MTPFALGTAESSQTPGGIAGTAAAPGQPLGTFPGQGHNHHPLHQSRVPEANPPVLFCPLQRSPLPLSLPHEWAPPPHPGPPLGAQSVWDLHSMACPGSSPLEEDREQLGNVRGGNHPRDPRALRPPGKGERGSHPTATLPRFPLASHPAQPGHRARSPFGIKFALWGHLGHLSPPEKSSPRVRCRGARGSSSRDALIRALGSVPSVYGLL